MTDSKILSDSGYLENTNASETFVLVSSGTFECPVENDGSLLLSTLQGQIPHANGLHYAATESDRLRAIRFDKRMGKLYAPADGWGQRIYTVSFANINTYGCLRAPMAVDRYDRATRTFRDSVDAVERLFDVSYEQPDQSSNKTVERLKQEIVKLRTRNKDLEIEKRRLETELDEKDKRILSLITEVPSPEFNSEKSDFLQQAMKIVHDKENELTKVLVERDLLKYQLKYQTEEFQLEQKSGDAQINSDEVVSQKIIVGAQSMPEIITDDQRSLETDLIINEFKDQQLQIAKQESQNAKDELQAANIQREQLAQELQEAQKIYHDTKWRNGELEATLKQKEREVERLNHEKNSIKAALENAHKELEETKQMCHRLKAQSAEQKNSKTETKEKEDVRWRIYELEAAATVAEKENFDLYEEVQMLKERLHTLQEQLANAKQHEQAVMQHSDDLNAAPDQYQTHPSTNNQEERLRNELAAANHRLTEMQNNLHHLQENEKELNNTLQCTKQELDDSKWRCGELEAMLMPRVVANAALDDAQKRNNELQRLYDEAMWRVNKMEAEIGLERQDLYDTQKKCGDLVFQLEEKNSNLNDAELTVKDLESMLSELQLRHDHLIIDDQKAVNGFSKSNLVFANASPNQVNETEILCQLDDSKNHINWLDGQVAHYKHLYHDTNQRLNELQNTLDVAHRHLWDSFVIRREPFLDRYKWNLSMWHENSNDHYARIWYEIDAPEAREVYLATSYYNWECLLLMMWHEHGKWGIWVDVPRGRHEFKFVIDGKWKTSNEFPTCPNNWNSSNNWRNVD